MTAELDISIAIVPRAHIDAARSERARRLVRGRPKSCWWNAAHLARRSRRKDAPKWLNGPLTYIEGHCVGIYAMTFEHGWCEDADGVVIDPTLVAEHYIAAIATPASEVPSHDSRIPLFYRDYGYRHKLWTESYLTAQALSMRMPRAEFVAWHYQAQAEAGAFLRRAREEGESP